MTLITKDLDVAVQILNQNEVVAIPTETVYGLAANAFNATAVQKIFDLKKRPLFNPLIVHLKSADEVEKVAVHIPEKAYQLIEAFWPGPLTLILEKQAHIPDVVTAGKNTVAVRMPNHPLTLELLSKLDYPLAAPSANPFKRISSTSIEHVYSYFKDELTCILDGGSCEKGVESSIIGFKGDDAVLYRHGAISIDEIEKITGKLLTITQNENAPQAPGMLLQHYSPKTRLILTADIAGATEEAKNKNFVVLTASKDNVMPGLNYHFLTENNDLRQAASNLYAALHHLDSLNLDLIIAEKCTDEGLGKTINDRLTRASAQ
nr:L-threonylcarbamoyladenylate synthase [uncultured Pedobacter sp.]